MRRMAMCLAGVFVLAGCKTQQPEYPAALVSPEPALVGAWALVVEKPEEGTVRLSFTETAAPVKDGRIDTAVNARVSPGGESVTIYQLHVEMDAAYDMFAYVLDLKGERLMGVQVTDEQASKGGPGGFVIPAHVLFRARVTPEELTLHAPKDGLVAWLPGVRLLDGVREGASGGGPAEGGTRVTPSLDRLIAYFREHAGEPGFWDEEHPLTFRRVR